MASSIKMIGSTRWCHRIKNSAHFVSSIAVKRKVSSQIPEETKVETQAADIDEDELEKITNVSGLDDRHRNKMSHVMKTPDIVLKFQKTAKYQRRVWAKYGSESGINPQIAWPTREELREIKEEEREWEPGLQEMWAKMEEKKQKEAAEIRKREALIEKNMSQMNKWMKEFDDRKKGKEKEKLKQQEKKLKVLEEAREFFGYDVDPKDAKFQEMVEEKELQAKKEAKLKKKQEKATKLAARLQSMALEAQSLSSKTETEDSMRGQKKTDSGHFEDTQGDSDSHEADNQTQR